MGNEARNELPLLWAREAQGKLRGNEPYDEALAVYAAVYRSYRKRASMAEARWRASSALADKAFEGAILALQQAIMARRSEHIYRWELSRFDGREQTDKDRQRFKNALAILEARANRARCHGYAQRAVKGLWYWLSP